LETVLRNEKCKSKKLKNLKKIKTKQTCFKNLKTKNSFDLEQDEYTIERNSKNNFGIKDLHDQKLTQPLQKYYYFKKIDKVLINIFLNRPLNKLDCALNDYEKKIVLKILLKKRFPVLKTEILNMKTLNEIREVIIKKKNEDELKFIIKKCIRHLQIEFISEVKYGNLLNHSSLKGVTMKDIKSNKDKYFYLYYFKSISEEEDIPIERFYHFRSWKNRFCKEIPKSITRESLDLWKKNPIFIKKIRDYINNSLKTYFFDFNIKKIHTMISKWEKLIDDVGEERGMIKILQSFDVKGSKLPWTVSEVQSAINHTLKCLS
jgi:hypothetical protein